MKAAVLQRINSPLEIRYLNFSCLLPGQVLVKVHYSGVCRSQLMEVKGGRGSDPWLPHLLGHEGSGEVVSIGEGVTKVKPGDAVILSWIKGSGLEAPGAIYHCGDQRINSGRVTTFSNYTIVSENRLTIKPTQLPMDLAVLFGCALPTGAGMILNQVKPDSDATIAILGLGGVGLSALMAIKGFSCNRIIAIDISSEKLDLAKDLGATHTLQVGQHSIYEEVMALTGHGVDICVESAGSVETIELGFSLIRKGGGRLWFASHPPEGQMIRLAPHDLISGKNIFGTWGGSSFPDRDVPIMTELFRKGQVPLERLLTKRYALEQVNEALTDLEAGRVFRPLLVMD
ncbi:zinc-binding dehydrogenase [Cylindrospermopsis raciborskii MVCC19]|nr:zinc-binding dehydrogenase [Cylindrospermopsis raciborskii MVCC19]OHY34224.1 acetoin dehydrogenase [Cylindrospermopsis raciborskii MVCC14]